MSAPAGGFEDLRAIESLKYRYLRSLDTKDWTAFESTLTEDVTGNYGESLAFSNRNELVGYMRENVGPAVITEHRVAHPEIEIDGDTARGRWYLHDRVIVAEFSFMLIGAAFYDDTYRRTADGWRISSTGYDRTYEATVGLADVPSFALKVGPAVQV
ncbi:nuclear transport factor 2 family protein [Gordonia hongkongensis]|uniref:Nuclear transport factor 2 family protein n=1 Tax=Gordonia hongkongensis TaxID=1701090 RepID=A0AAX3T6I8_9ACTN|nr:MULTISPECIES: nuclear transport factor 2 family protein [Gordonia]QIK46450.1 nuclear transport factor 2 family protein [Gordonia terrae]MBR7193632.1 nuclear transport factor 2 family protein [Gordonia sp. SCSIO 19800]MDT0221547.1 nuclear transport factor 2 family protein [Gordonia sp. AC31]WFP24559.1 nuclear transport factor 2 family protein [Gordonia hongkongensis]WGJ85253.1 nuclear transport factor 2 family protein [Gordonia sp. SMJS1]